MRKVVVTDAPGNKGNCDFCADLRKPPLPAEWRYTTEPFVIEKLTFPPEGPRIFTFKSDDVWLACAACALAIEADDIEALLLRVPEAHETARFIFKGFFDHKIDQERIPFTGPVNWAESRRRVVVDE